MIHGYSFAGVLLSGSTNNWESIFTRFNEFCPNKLLRGVVKFERNYVAERRCNSKSGQYFMCKSRDYVFVPSFELGIGFFEKEHPQSSLLRFDESCAAGIILENWDKVINHDLFGLA